MGQYPVQTQTYTLQRTVNGVQETVTVTATYTASYTDRPAAPRADYHLQIDPCNIVDTDEFREQVQPDLEIWVDDQVNATRNAAGYSGPDLTMLPPTIDVSDRLIQEASKCLISQKGDDLTDAELTSSFDDNGQGSAVLTEANGKNITASFDNQGIEPWSEKITTTGPEGDVQQIETDNRDGSTIITGFDQSGNQTWQLNQAADGSGSLSAPNGTTVDFASGQLADFSRASDGSGVLTLVPDAGGLTPSIVVNGGDGTVTVSMSGNTAFTTPAGTQVQVGADQSIVATLPSQNNLFNETITVNPDGTITQTCTPIDSQGDPAQVFDQPDPATGTVDFKSVTDNGQTTQVGSGDTADTDGGLQESLAKLAGTNPPADEPGSNVTDPGNHPPNDPLAPFAADHPSPVDPRDPLVLDLAGTGVNLSSVTQSSAFFDFTGSGFATKTGWITQGEGLLVLNGNPNAPISVNELVGAQSGDGFADLAALDTDGDGVINASDPAFANLSVWVDANGNGQLDSGELVSLGSLGITAISLSTTPSGQTINGNTVVSTGTFQMTEPSGPVTNAIAEVDLATQPVESRYTPPAGFAYNWAVFSLPQLIGYGTVPNLWVAMSQNPPLLADVRNLVLNAASMSAAQFDAAFQAIVWEWVGASNIDPSSRGSYIDARHLAVDYAFYGIDQTTQPVYQLNPNWHSGPLWETVYESIVDELKVRFVGQLAGGELLNGADPASIVASWFMAFTAVKIDLHNDTVTVNFNQLIHDIVSDAPSDPTAAATYYQQVMPIVRSLRVDLFSEQAPAVTAAVLAAAGSLGYGTGVQTALLNALGQNSFITAASSTTGVYDTSFLQGTTIYDLGIGTFGTVTARDDQAVVVEWGSGDSSQAFNIESESFQNVGAVALNNLNRADVSFYRSGSTLTDLTIANKATGATLTLDNEFVNTWDGVATIVFGNGMVWQTSDIAANSYITAASSTSGSYDDFFQFNFPVIYDLGTGTFGNVNAGHDGVVKVIWGAGDSSQAFTISGDGNNNNIGSLLLNNLNPSDVSCYRSGSTLTDLTIANKATGATLTFSGEFANPWYGVASVTFANGTVWQASTIAANTYITPSSSTTGVYDTSNLTGTIIYDLGTGTFGNVTAAHDQAVEIIWGAADSSQTFLIDGRFGNVGSLVLGNLNPGDVTFYRSGSNFSDVTIRNNATGATLTLTGQSADPLQGVTSVTFANGTVWHTADIAANSYVLAVSSTTGSYDSNNLTGAIVYDLGTGTFGNVTAAHDQAVEIIWGAADSSQTFLIDGRFGNVGSLMLGNLNPGDVTFYRSGSNFGDVTIKNNATGATLTLTGQIVNWWQGVTSVTFANGTVWQSSTIAANSYITAASSTTGSYDASLYFNYSVIYDLGIGTFGNVTAHRNGAVEVIWGASDSTQAFSIDGDANFDNVGSLILNNLNPTDVSVYRSGANFADLTIANKAAGKTLTFYNEFGSSAWGVASVTFGNGTVWHASDIAANSYITAASSTTGSYDSNNIVGAIVYDLGTGTFGNVTAAHDQAVEIIWGAADSSQTFLIDGRFGNVGSLVLGNLNPGDLTFYRTGLNFGDLTIKNNATGATLTLTGQIADSLQGVTSITFANGTVWQASTIVANSYIRAASSASGSYNTDFLFNNPVIYDLGTGTFGNVSATRDGAVEVIWGAADSSQAFTLNGDGNGNNTGSLILNGLNPSNVSFYRSGPTLADLVIQNKTTGHTLTFSGEFAASFNGVASVTFADGTVWNQAQIAANTPNLMTTPTDTSNLPNLTYYLGPGDYGNVNAFHDDPLTIEWARGDGNQTFTVTSNNTNDAKVVLLGLNPSDISVIRSGGPQSFANLTIVNKSTGKTLTLLNQFSGNLSGINAINFADGTIWQASTIGANSYITAASSTTGSYDAFFIFNYPVVYDLGTGTFGNVNAGRDGVVKVIWGAGDSSQQFTISGDGNNNNIGTLVLNNLNLSDVSFYRSGSTFTDLTIANKSNGNKLTFYSEFANPWYGVASITFGTGTVWQAGAIAANTYITAASSTTGVYDTGNLTGTIIYDLGTGTFGPVTAGHDQAVEIMWGAGDSSQTFLIDGRFGNVGSLLLGNLNPGDVTFYRSGSNFSDVTIKNNATGVTLTLTNQIANWWQGVTTITFANGTVWQPSTIGANSYITAASSTTGVYDDFFTFNYPVIYDLGTGSFGNVNAGRDGIVEVIWGAGDSSQQFTISGDGNNNNIGTLVLNGLNPSDVSFYRSGSSLTDLTIKNKSTGATLTLYGELANAWYGVATVDFANGTVWHASTIGANSYVLAGSSTTGSYDAFFIFNYPVVYDLGTGTFGNVNAGRDGAVEVIWGAGDSSQQFTISGDGNNNNIGSLVLNGLNRADVSFYRSGSTLTDLTIKNNASGATLTFYSEFANPWYGVASITFGNGTVWQASTIAANTYITAASSTTGVYDTGNLTGTIIYDLGTGTFGPVTAGHDQAVEVIWGAADSSQTFLIDGRFGNVGSLLLGNLNPGDVTFYRTGSNFSDLSIKNNTTGTTLTLTNQSVNWWQGVTTITFGNSTVWQTSDIAANSYIRAISSTSGVYDSNNLSGTTIYDLGTGTFGNVTAGHDQAVQIIWGAGDSSQTFLIDGRFGNVGSVVLSNLKPTDLSFVGSGTNLSDLTIKNNATGATLTLTNEQVNWWQGTASITFANGTVWLTGIGAGTTLNGSTQPGAVAAYFRDNMTVSLATGTANLNGSGGHDTLVGLHAGIVLGASDTLIGDNAGDTLSAAGSDDIVHGGTGNDTLIINGGTDTFFGGGGNDTFEVLSATVTPGLNQPQNLIADFNPGNPNQLIDLSRFTGIRSFADLHFSTVTFGAQSYLQVALGSTGQAITLAGVTADQLSASNFVFAPPTLTVQGASGSEHQPIALNISARENDPNGTLSLTISGIPADASLSNSRGALTFSNGSITFTSAQLAGGALNGLSITPASDANFALTVTATTQHGTSFDSTTQTMQVVVAPLAPTVTVSGSAQEGQTLTASAVTTDGNVTIGYQWQSSSDGQTWNNLSGATSSTYTGREGDEGLFLRVSATATDSEGNSTSATSAATAVVVDIASTLSVSVSGTAQEGQTLTATAVANDADAVVTYQWQSFNGTTWSNISGATSATYTAVEADEGSQLRVIATSSDPDGGGITAISSATAVVIDIAPTLSVTISGTAQEGQTLTATAVVNDADAFVSYQWQSLSGSTWSNISGATSSTYSATAADDGHQLRVVATSTDSDSSGTTAMSAATAAITPAVSVTVSGTAQEGQTLTATAVAGNGDVVTYQWQGSNDGTTWANIAGATNSTYTAVEADEGNQLRVIATASSGGSGTSVASAATAAVIDVAPTLSVTISGAAQEGQTLTATAVANDADAAVTYQWQSFNGTTWSNIAGATSTIYTAGEGDEGNQLRVVATSTDSDSSGTTVTSAATGAVVDIAPTLSVTVSGTAQEGQVLTATGIANDSDAVVTYQWQSLTGSTWSNISSATAATYTVGESDEGHQLRVVATSSDADGSGTTATSSATALVVDIAPTLSVTVSGNAQEGQTLTAAAVANDSDAVVTYQWQSLTGSTWSNISGATGSAYTAAEADEGHQLGVIATLTDSDGSGTSATSAATAAVIDIAPTLSVSISGTAQEGQTLTASAGANDSDAVITYQWQSLSGSTWSNISGGTASTYTATEADEGHQLRVVATSTDSDGSGTTATSAATAAVIDIAPALSASISGTAQEGQTLIASAVANDSDAVVTYQWQTLGGSTWSNISGATASTYTAAEADEGHQLRVVATSTDSDGSGTTATSAATAAVIDIAPTLSVSISGTAQEGQTLTASAAANDGDAVVSYQWQSLSGSTWSNISGASASTYTATEADEGHQLRVVATSTDSDGCGTTATSAATAAVTDIAPTLSVTVSGTAQEGQTLTASAVANDSDAVVSYQWQSLSGSTWSNISGAAASTYTATEADEGHQLRIIATSTDSDSSGTTATSAATAAVIDIAPTLSVSVSGTAHEGQTFTATAVANDADALVSYQWQSLSGSTWSNISGATGSTYSITGADEGHQLRVIATSTDSDGSGTTATSAATAVVFNNPPTLSNVAANDQFTEAGSAVTLAASAAVSDPDNLTLARATVAIAGGTFAGDGDVLAASTNGTSITASYNSTTETLTLSGSDTLVHYQQVLDSVTFASASQNPTNYGSKPTRTLTWVLDDGSASNDLSAPQTTTVSITAVNNPPTLSNVAANDQFTEAGAAITLAASAAVSDPDNLTLARATVAVAGGAFAGDGDVLAATTTGTSITTSYNTTTETLILSGSDTLVHYQQVLDSVTFASASQNPTNYGSNPTRNLTWTLDDGGTSNNLGAPQTTTVSITAVNNAPTLSGVPASASFTQGAAAATLAPSVTVSDPDNLKLVGATVRITGGTFASDGDVLAATTTGTAITASYSSSTETLTLTGSDTLADYRQVLDSVTFNSTSQNPTNSGSNPNRIVTWVVNDGSTSNNLSAAQTETIGIAIHNPTLSNVAASVQFTENHSALTLSGTVTVTDAKSTTLARATVAITGGTFAGDGDVLAATTTSTSITASYNSTTETLTLSGTDTLAHYQSVLRSVTFTATGHNPDDYGSNPTRTVTWLLNDGGASNNLSLLQTETVGITALNDPPTLSNVATTKAFTEAGAAATLSPSVTVADPDNLTLANATVRIAGGTFASDGDLLAATTTGTAMTASYNSSTETLTLTGSDTLADYRQVLDSVTFGSTSSNPTNYGSNPTRTVTWVLNDGSASSNTSTTQTETVSITAINNAPTLSGVAASVQYTSGGAAVTLSSAVTVADPDNLNLTKATVAIGTGTFAGDGDVLAATTTSTSITASYNSTTETLTLSGSDTLAHYQSVLRSVTFKSTNANPTNSGADPTRVLTWLLNDGSASNNLSAPATTTIAIPPVLTIGNPSITVAAGGSIALPITVSPSGSAVTVSIAGLVSYETITDHNDSTVFSGSSVTLTAAEVNSGLTLHSSYAGTGHPVNTLTVTANDTANGQTSSSAPQTITVTDPPLTTTSSTDPSASESSGTTPRTSTPDVDPNPLAASDTSPALWQSHDTGPITALAGTAFETNITWNGGSDPFGLGTIINGIALPSENIWAAVTPTGLGAGLSAAGASPSPSGLLWTVMDSIGATPGVGSGQSPGPLPFSPVAGVGVADGGLVPTWMMAQQHLAFGST